MNEHIKKRPDPFAELIAKQKYMKQEYDAKKKQEEERKNANFFERAGHTIGDFFGNVVGGVSQGIEGIIDFAAGTVGTIGGWFGNEGMKQGAQNFIANDWTGDNIKRPLAEATKYSYVNDMGETGQNITRGVASGVGQMLPSIVISAIPGGQAAGMGVFMGGAAGGGVQQALNDGAGLDKAMAYGTMSGLAEGAVEKLTGGIGGTQAGKVLGKQLGKTTAGKLATTFVGEGAEEVLSDLLDPALQRMTYNPEAEINWEQLPETFAIGGLTGLTLGGAGQAVAGMRNRDVGGLKGVNAAENLQTYNEIGAEANLRQAQGKAVNESRYNSNRSAYLENVSKQLVKMKPEQRTAFLSRYKLAGVFDNSGRVVGQSMPTAAGNTAQTAYNAEAYTPSLKGRESSLSYQPTRETLSTAQREAVNNVIKLKNGQVDVVITNGLAEGENGAYRNGVLYISDKANAPMVTAAHELTHTLEGTKEYEALYKHISQNVPDLEVKLAEYKQRYAKHRAESGQASYSAETQHYEAQTELVADYVGELMSKPEAVERIAAQNRSLAVRVYNWVKSKIKALAGKGGETLAYYQKAEKLYAKALKTGFGGVPLSELKVDQLSSYKDNRFDLKDTWEDLKKYSESDVKSIESNKTFKIAYSYEDIKAFIENAKQGGSNQFLFLGRMTKKTANFIHLETGIDVEGKSIVLTSNDLIHIFNRHGNEAVESPHGQIAITKTNIENIIEAIISPDAVKKEIDSNNAVKIIFEKTINGKNVAITVLSNKKNALTLKSARITKERHISPSNDTYAPPSTSKTLGSMNATLFNNSITQSGEKVNSLTEENAKKEENRYSLDTKTKVLEKVPIEKQSKLESAKDQELMAEIKLINAQVGIERYGKKLGIADIDAKTNAARSARNAAEAMLTVEQRNREGKVVGKNLQEVFSEVEKHREGKGKNAENPYKVEFLDYLLHLHNVDRMAQGKPVFGKEVTAQMSKEQVAEYEKAHPEFAKLAKGVWKYNDNLLQFRVDYGLITQKQADDLRAMYPHYVPTYRNVEPAIGTGSLKGKYNLAVKDTIKNAKGGEADILPLDVIIARQTMETVKAAKVNEIMVSLYKASRAKRTWQKMTVLNTERVRDIDIDYSTVKPMNNEITFFHEGKRITAKVTADIFEGINAFAPVEGGSQSAILQGIQKANMYFKKLVTAWNPFFLVRNALRDLQDAGLYTKYGKTFIKNYGRAYKEITTKGNYWREYQTAGGLSSSVFEFNQGIKKETGNIFKKAEALIENANMVIEQAPRLAEYISSREAGNSMEQALLEAADVTVNFGRTGTFTKKLNSTVIPFLNPAIQGWSKLWRTVTGRKTGKQWLSLVLRAALLGIVPAMLNGLLFDDDDEEYNSLNDRDKDNNFLFRVGDVILKLPKGRVNAVLGSLYLRGKRAAQGDEQAWEGFLSNALSSLTPADTVTRTIISPFLDAASNKTWYGGEIEGQKFNNVQPKNRYDENTSSLAVALGKLLNYSPKKIHYLIDSYTGVIGDFILPLTTPKAERNPIAGNFTIDPVLQNKYSQNFYDAIEKARWAKTDGDPIAAAKVRYLNKVSSAVSKLYQEKREVQNSKLGDKDKLAQVKVIQALINQAQKTALEDWKQYEAELKAGGYSLTEESFDEDYREATREVFGAERALKEYNKNVYQKAQLFNAAKIDYDLFYQAYFYLREIEADLDEDGNTIAGSRKKQVAAYIEKLPITKVRKQMLYALAGYKNKDGEDMARYIRGLSLTQQQRAQLLKTCGAALTKREEKLLDEA